MSDPTAFGFNPGGLKDRVDDRDFQYSEVGFGTPPFDWVKGYDIEQEIGKLPVKDQNGSFSCGGQAWATYAAALEAAFTGSLEERSAKFIYAQTYQAEGGSTGRDNAEIFKSQGAARETVLSSYPATEVNLTRGQDITAAMRNDASFDKSASYSQVKPDSIDDIARAIRDNYGVVIGITGQNNGTWTSAFPKAPTTAKGLWNHWVYAGREKLINGVKHIGILNSWGPSVGVNGWQWIEAPYFLATVNQMKMVWSCWTHTYSHPVVQPFTHNFTTDMKYGDSGPEITALQSALKIENTFPQNVPTRGYFGGVSLDSVIKFQLKYGIKPSVGYVGILTRTKLNEFYNK